MHTEGALDLLRKLNSFQMSVQLFQTTRLGLGSASTAQINRWQPGPKSSSKTGSGYWTPLASPEEKKERKEKNLGRKKKGLTIAVGSQRQTFFP